MCCSQSVPVPVSDPTEEDAITRDISEDTTDLSDELQQQTNDEREPKSQKDTRLDNLDDDLSELNNERFHNDVGTDYLHKK